MREWVKLYRDEPARFASLSLGARMLAAYMLKFADKDGRFPLGKRDPVTAIALTIGADVADRRALRRHVAELFDHGYLVVAEGTVNIASWPKYQTDLKPTPTEHEPSTNRTRTRREPSTNPTRTEHEPDTSFDLSARNDTLARSVLLDTKSREEEKRGEESNARPPTREASPPPGTDAMLRSLTPTPDRDAQVVALVTETRGTRFKPISHTDRDAVSRLGEWASGMPGGMDDLRRALVAFWSAKGRGASLRWLADEDPGRYLSEPTKPRARGMAPATSHAEFDRLVKENGGENGVATLTFD